MSHVGSAAARCQLSGVFGGRRAVWAYGMKPPLRRQNLDGDDGHTTEEDKVMAGKFKS